MATDKPYRDGQVLKRLYHEEKMLQSEIADEFGVSEITISEWMDKHDIERRSQHEDAEMRFERNYEVDDETECWEWQGAKRLEYGAIGYKGRTIGAHRLSYILHNGEIPEGAYICHKCHNRSCVNPDHIYAGDHQDNVQDAIENGDYWSPSGVDAYHSKFTDAEVRKIREEYADGETVSTLTDKYDSSMGTISRIVTGKTYPDAGGPTDVDTHDRMARRGSDANSAKLTADEVREIRRMYAERDLTMAEVGEEFGVSSTTVCDIVNRKIWQHVD